MTDRETERWAADTAPALVAAAREEALAEARAALRERYVRALLAAAEPPPEAPAPAEAPPPPAVPVPPQAPAPPEPPRARAEPARAHPAESPGAGGEALWAFGVVPAGVAPPDLPGPDGDGRVAVVAHGDLAALVAPVPLETFGTDPLQRSLEDLDRVEALARAHEAVLDAALAGGPVVPFRLATIYADEEHVRAMLDAERAVLAAALARIHGMVELGVKGFLVAPEPEPQAAGVASGTDYLTQKRAARDAAEATRGATETAVATIHARLAEQAADAVLGRPQDRRLSGRDAEMVLNASYLVPAAGLDGFRERVRSLSADGIELEITGPWPAYHFAEAR
jgi:hypothetical protein